MCLGVRKTENKKMLLQVYHVKLPDLCRVVENYDLSHIEVVSLENYQMFLDYGLYDLVL